MPRMASRAKIPTLAEQKSPGVPAPVLILHIRRGGKDECRLWGSTIETIEKRGDKKNAELVEALGYAVRDNDVRFVMEVFSQARASARRSGDVAV